MSHDATTAVVTDASLAPEHDERIALRDRKILMLEEALSAYEREVQVLQQLVDYQALEHSRAAVTERDAMASSTSWRITQPLRAVAGVMRRDPNYLEPLLRFVGRSRPPAQDVSLIPESAAPHESRHERASEPDTLAPLATYPEPGPHEPARITLMLASLAEIENDTTSLLASLFAVGLAQCRGWRLRIVTRQSVPDACRFAATIGSYGMSYARDMDLEASPWDWGRPALGVLPSERFVTTEGQIANRMAGGVHPASLCIIRGAGTHEGPSTTPDTHCLQDQATAQGRGLVTGGLRPSGPETHRAQFPGGLNSISLKLPTPAPRTRAAWVAVFAPIWLALTW